jgi:hypothetical protein
MLFLSKTPFCFFLALAVGTAAVQTAGLVHLPRTGQTSIYATSDDGDIQAGAVWPDPRFTVNGDCVTDNLTGLMWGKISSNTMSWASALTHPRSLTICGLSDWRLPNINELESLVNVGEMSSGSWLNTRGFILTPGVFWSSTTVAMNPAFAWGVDMKDGSTGHLLKSDSNYYIVLPVRETISSSSRLWQTGQTQCYDTAGVQLPNCVSTGQDGEYQAGVVWPAQRFTVSGDCVTDNLTGLMWVKTPESSSRIWQEALTYAKGRSLCGYGSGWRLPNRKELLSLESYESANPIAWLNGQGFSNVQDSYWSSTTYADLTPDKAWTVHMVGGPNGHSKADSYYVWPVRGGDLYPPSDAFPPVNLPRTGQKICSDPSGTVIPCANTGQDGDVLAGAPWPNTRFTISGNCATDNLTGLIWTKNANIGGTRSWQGALDGVALLNNLGGWCGQTDWRLPNVNELESLVNAGNSAPNSWLTAQGFTNVQPSMYWTSTTYATSASYAWIIKMDTGQVFGNGGAVIDKNSLLFVWPVRGRNTGPAKLWKTGQTTSYASRDDGDLETGVALPSQRFAITSVCILDNLTRLIWARTPESTSKTWQGALTYANGLSLCGYTDWRLPNSKELRSLVNYEYVPSNWLNDSAQGFHGIINGAYWTSTANAASPAFAWFVSMDDGVLNFFSKTANATLVWPVRGGFIVPPLYLPVIIR